MTRTRWIAVVVFMLVFSVVAFAAGGKEAATGTAGTTSTDTWTAADVKAASDPYEVVPIAAIPKHLKKKWVLAFANPDMSVPFFKSWSDGIHAATKFYGVTLLESDMQGRHAEDVITHFQTMMTKQADIFGTLTTSTTALKQAADAEKKIVIPIDIPLPNNDPYYLGVPNDKAGELGGQILGPALKTKMDGAWKGRSLTFLGVTESTAESAVTRVESGLKAVRTYVAIPDSSVVRIDTAGRQEAGRTKGADVLTAHPNDVIVAIAYNDECGVGFLQAAQAAGREQDVLLVTLGADLLARSELRKHSPAYLAAVDYNPWAEGWNWVEAAIITLEGGTFKAYDIHRAVMADNVDKLYAQDLKQ